MGGMGEGGGLVGVGEWMEWRSGWGGRRGKGRKGWRGGWFGGGRWRNGQRGGMVGVGEGGGRFGVEELVKEEWLEWGDG